MTLHAKGFKFHIFRCIGILAAGMTAFYLAVMQSRYDWIDFFKYLFRDYMDLFLTFITMLIIAAVLLSIEEE